MNKNDKQDHVAYWKIMDQIENRSRARAKKVLSAEINPTRIRHWTFQVRLQEDQLRYDAIYKETYDRLLATAEPELAKFRPGGERHSRWCDEGFARWHEEMNKFESQQRTRRRKSGNNR